jgi:hypothetical protein
LYKKADVHGYNSPIIKFPRAPAEQQERIKDDITRLLENLTTGKAQRSLVEKFEFE